VKALVNLLDKNGIQYGTASGSEKGYNYQTKKEEAFTIGSNDIVISATQPRAAMTKVFFEPNSILVDSATYDITAWSLPYVYGLNAYATTRQMNTLAKPIDSFVNNIPADAYGYVIRWQDVSAASATAQLISKGIKVRYAIFPFETGGKSFGSGSVIITKKGNEKFGNNLWTLVNDVCNKNAVKINAVSTGMVDKGFDFGSDNVHFLKAPKVVLLTGEGVSSIAAGEVWNFFENELKYNITLVNATDFAGTDWSNIDVIIMPDGKYSFLSDKDNARQFEQWIKNGGRVVALESAVAQLSKQEWSTLKAKTNANEDSTQKKQPYAALKNYGEHERKEIEGTTPGSIYRVEVDNTHPLMVGYPKYYYTLKMDSVVYEFMKEGGWNVGVIKKENQVAGFVGYKLNPKLKDGLLFGVQEVGKGSVTYLTDDILFRNFWENGKLMFCNAVFLVGQ
jgi:hypothetical protein